MIVPDAWLSTLSELLPRIHERSDPESVHQLRVAAGRLAVWLELGDRRALRDDLRALRRHASHVRDLDVVIEDADDEDWKRVLREERDRRARELAARLSERRFDALLRALHVSAPVEESIAREAVARLEARVLSAGRRLEREGVDPRALHRLRRALRRLRYALEWLGEDVEPLKELQERLGDVNNLAVRLRYAEESPLRASLSDLRADTQRRIEKDGRRALASWRSIEARIRKL